VSLLLWGTAGCGKTHLANTAPGKRLFLNFDPDGTAALPNSDDTLLLDYSHEPDSCVSQAFSVNPYDIDGILKKDASISTVVVDSVTAFTTKAVAYSVGNRNAPGAVHENPGPAGYGFRNRHALGLCRNLLLVTGRHGRNIVFICHEDTPDKDKDGNVIAITILLGGSLPTEVPIQISEVWHMQDRFTSRVVQVRNVGVHRPMKSRMFDTSNGYEFEVSNKTNQNKVRLDTLFTQWRDAKYEKIKLPI
jgi:hypothetical protein